MPCFFAMRWSFHIVIVYPYSLNIINSYIIGSCLHRISPNTSHQTSPHQVIIFNSESALTPGCDASQHYSSTPLYTYLPPNTVPWIPQSLVSHSPLDLTLPWITKPLDLTTLDLFTILWIWSLLLSHSLLSQSSGSTVPWIKSPYQPQVLDPHSLLDRLSLLDLLRLLAQQSSGSTVFHIYSFFWIYTTLH